MSERVEVPGSWTVNNFQFFLIYEFHAEMLYTKFISSLPHTQYSIKPAGMYGFIIIYGKRPITDYSGMLRWRNSSSEMKQISWNNSQPIHEFSSRHLAIQKLFITDYG